MSSYVIPGLSSLQRSWHKRELKRLIAVGNQANAKRDWANAAVAYEAALAINPELGEIWVQYGHSLKEQGFLQRAEQAYRRSIALNDAISDTYLQLGHVLKLQGQTSSVKAAYTESYLRDPTSPNSGQELRALGVEPPDAQSIAAFRAHTTQSPPGRESRPDRRVAMAAPPVRNSRFAADPAFLQAVYGTKTAPDASPHAWSKFVYVSVQDLLDVHDLKSDFQSIFDYKFYFYTNKSVQHDLTSPSLQECLVHFCEKGIEPILAFNEIYIFDQDFYRSTYLNDMPFTPANAYRHWLCQGLPQNWAPNRKVLVRRLLGKDVQNIDKLEIALRVAIVDPNVNARGWQGQFEHLVDSGALDTRVPLLVDDSTVGAIVAIADHQAIHGREQHAFALYQRILQQIPRHSHALRHYADGLLQRNCPLEAKRIYRQLVEAHDDPSIWSFISLARCNELLGLPGEALTALRLGIDVFPGDVGLRRRFDVMAGAYFTDTWDTAVAAGRLDRFEWAQNRLAEACVTISTLIRAPERLPARPIRSVALVVNKDLNQCRFYRIDQKIEQLELAGYTVGVYDFHHDIPRFLNEVYRYEAAIFYRVPSLYPVIEAIEKAKELGLITFYEIDDLIFDAREYPDTLASYDGQIGREEYIGLKIGVPLFAHALALCDYGLASTPSLAGQMAKHAGSGKAMVHRNAFGHIHEVYAARASNRAPGRCVTIFYGSGTKAHKEDFQQLVEPALVELVRRHGDGVAIVLMGYVTMTERLRSIEANITLIEPNWNINDYWAMLSQVDINIAVLKPSLMADCKSEIKWLEAAMLGVPSVVSDTATYREVVEPGVTGLICSTAQAWTAALDSLVRDPKLRRQIGQAARRRAIASYGMPSMADHLTRLFQDVSPMPDRQRKPTILIVNVFYPPQAIGGATRVVHDNVRHLAQTHGDRFHIEVFTTIEGGLEPYQLSSYAKDGVRVTGVTTPDEADIDRKSVDERMGDVFGRFLDHVRPDLVHFHCIQRLTTSIVSATLDRDIPYLISVHDGWWISDSQFLLDAAGSIRLYNYGSPIETLQSLGQGAFDRLMRLQRPLQGAVNILAVSAPFAGIYQGCDLQNVVTLANGVSDLPTPKRIGSADGRVRLGFIGGMAMHKGYDILKYAIRCQAFAHLALIVIDHSMSPGETRQEVWGSTLVDFRPKRAQADIGRLYGEIDVLLAPSIWPESYGLVTREALHCGCWVVASDRGSIGEYVVDGENGFIVDVSSPADLIAKLQIIDDNPSVYLSPPRTTPQMRQASDQGEELAAFYAGVIEQSGAASMPPAAEIDARLLHRC